MISPSSNRASSCLAALLAWCALPFATAGEAATPEGAMSKPLVYVSGYAPTISCFRFDPASGALTPASSSEGGKNPSYLAWHPSRKHLYAINEGGDGRVIAFSIAPADGALTRINDASAAGKGPCHLAVHPSGKWLITANYGSGHVGVLPIREDGGVGEPTQIELPGGNAHQAVIDPSGRFVFVPCLGSNHVAQFRFDAATGKLQANEPATLATAQGAGPRHLDLHPSGTFAYVLNELDDTILSCAYDAQKGLLSAPAVLPTLPPGVDGKGNSTAHVVVSPDGRFVYASNRGHDSLVIHAIDQKTGRLTLVGHENGGGEIKVPRDFTLTPDGRFALVASQKGDVLLVFAVDREAGTLRKLSSTKVPPGPSFVGVMPAP